MKFNFGYLFSEVIGKCVCVKLVYGGEGVIDVNFMSLLGWVVDGKGGCNWWCLGSFFDIVEYEVIV